MERKRLDALCKRAIRMDAWGPTPGLEDAASGSVAPASPPGDLDGTALSPRMKIFRLQTREEFVTQATGVV